MGPPLILECPAKRLNELFRLRCTVWLGEGADPAAFPNGEWSDPLDAIRRHWIALAGEQVVAVASLSVHASLAEVHQGEVYLRHGLDFTGLIAAPARVAVLRGHRSLDVIHGLLARQDAASREAGAVVAVRQASPRLRPHLLRRGWREHGPGLTDPRFPGIQFIVMSRLLQESRGEVPAPDPLQPSTGG
jgi:hypothetical protein